MSIIHIADHLTDEILDDITEDKFWSDNHHKSLLNNQETFDFVTFADKPYSQYLEKMNRIIIPDEDGELVELFIRNTRKYREGDAVLTEVYTSATYVKLKTAKQMTPHRTEAITASAHAIRALNGTEWEPGNIDFKGVRTFTFDDYVNPYDYLRRIASEFDLELRFRVETDGNKITKRYVDIVEYVGAWDGKEVEFEKDLAGIERKEDFSNVVTALIGLGPEDEEGNRLSVLVEDEEALQRWGRNGQHIIGIYEPESTDASMTIERLTTLTENELEKRINSKIQYLADVVDLERVIGLEHEKLRFGDVIRIKDLKFNPPLYLEARVHTIDRSIKPRGHKTVTLGDFTEYTEEDVHAIVKDLRRQLRNKIGLGDLEELTYTKPEVDQKVADVVDDAEKAAVEVVDSIEIGGRNIASVDSVGTTGVTRDGYTYTIAKTGSSNPFMRIPTSRFEENKRYVISFKVKKISGNVTSLAGHDQSFRGMPVNIYRDGVRIEDVATWSVGDQNYPNDDAVHEYEIHLKTPETFPSDDSAPYWYIQPNRPNYGENYELELWNFQIEQATKKSNWERPQEDVDKDIKEAKDEAEEAKQTAENAQQSANGKNTVFRQSTEPSTEGRVEGDLWFKTDEGNKMFVWTGNWTPTELDFQALSIGQLSAISADLGDVTAGNITGVTLNLANGKFVVDENGNIVISESRFVTTGIDPATGTNVRVIIDNGLITLEDIDTPTTNSALNAEGFILNKHETEEHYTKREEPRRTVYTVTKNSNNLNLNTVIFEVYPEFTNVASDRLITIDSPEGIQYRNILQGIIEQGSNENGEYIRFANGLQICFLSEFRATTSSSGGLAANWTYPAAFISAPFTYATVNSSNYINYGVTVQRPTNSQAIFRGYGLAADTQYTLSAFAIGRWK